LFCAAIEVKSVGFDSDSATLNIQMVQTYTRYIVGLPITVTLHNFVTCSINDKKVSYHADHFDVASLVNNVPIVSRLYDMGRSVAGSVTSNVFKTLHSLYNAGTFLRSST
jgi:hypothetical protein